MTSRVIVALRVQAAPERAFEVFTREIGLWWRPSPLFPFTPRSPGVLAFEPGAGGRFIETLASGNVFEIGRIGIWDPPHRLSFTWRQASFAPGQRTEVEVRFEPVGEETRVTVEHRGWDSIPVENPARHGFPEAVFLRRNAEWWRELLSGLASRLS